MTPKQALRIFGLNAKFYCQNEKTQSLVRALLQYDAGVVLSELKNVIAFVVSNPLKYPKAPSRHFFLNAVHRNLFTKKPAPAPMHPDVAALVNNILKGWGHNVQATKNDNHHATIQRSVESSKQTIC